MLIHYKSNFLANSIRGMLSSCFALCFNIGIMLGYAGGAFLDYNVEPFVMLSLPILFLCTFVFLPNSPQQLLRNNKTEVCIGPDLGQFQSKIGPVNLYYIIKNSNTQKSIERFYF